MTHQRLDLGALGAALDLVDADHLAGSREFWFTTRVDNFDFGTPQATRIIVASLLRDGDDERIERYGNRTLTFEVKVHSTTGRGLGRGEKALGLLIGRRTELRWHPPIEVGSLTRFVVLTSEWSQVPNDLAEATGDVRVRIWRLTLTCEPFGTSAEQETLSFEPTTVEPTVVDTASSAARWTAARADSVATSTYGDGSSLRVETRNSPQELVFTADAPLSQAYVGIDIARSPGVKMTRGREDDIVAVEPGENYTRYWFRNPGTAKLTFFVRSDQYATSQTGPYWFIGGLYAAPSINARGMVVADIDGSVRTEGTLTVTRGTTMAWLTAYTDPTMLTNGWTPNLQGTWANAPAGRYVLYARGGGIATEGNISATITASGRATDPERTFLTGASDGWRPLGEFLLGSRRDGLLGTVTVNISRDGNSIGSGVELRLFRVDDDTALTVLQPGSGTSEYVLEPPTLDQPLGALWADNTSAEHRAISWEFPYLAAGPVAMFIEADNPTTAPVKTVVDYWAKWRGFAP